MRAITGNAKTSPASWLLQQRTSSPDEIRGSPPGLHPGYVAVYWVTACAGMTVENEAST
ncbi:hypothetical protein [Zestomonas carbonaria]|uniref:hypothetical protein n=1 Tax=Zestomonas carbonaria TaxID=2762745 RepID=UPI00165760E7|nr:hypothetical protein [Pseudomonas carbonaria]